MAMMAATTLTLTPPRWSWRPTRRSFCRQMHPGLRGLGMYRNGGSIELNVSAWDDKPFEMLPSGNKAYLDEQDVVTFLDPPKDLIPFDPSSYNPAAYLWKKIEDIPQERRHRLLRLLKPRLVSIAWQIAGTRFDDPKLVKKSASTLLSSSTNDGIMLECYNCTSSGGPMSISWINSFRKAIFTGKDGQAYGRIISGSVLTAFADSFAPLYFTVRELKEVMSTEQPCDLAYEFGDGLHDIKELPLGFPRPVKHPYPFNDQIVVYVRYLGPGVSVGQAWQEGTKLEQVPRKLCGEILMVKDYTSLQEDQ
ncbi:hypothetical protein JHK82_017154 [Glycine max]|uniref:Uncharacterized protein n=1 Tax=Glycine soja TaxID=3848 RepID=A0A445JQB5_GLYSO|nr:uncharacterized protein LOC114417890 [Glycine soja]KAG5141459.1 hypothetical protein JHK82_017154 [Glycine max]KAG5008581.1 hypothetical protein JHK87_017096 [Glycine soja]KAH1084631.1 hypothetical protein GYH30_016971 [Glycine max]KAH1084632.1 hypothetical protein GYH30_016971 [Glycine max]KHN39358.1 hypothetical protein glysoja_018130 [Glycine soja]